MNNKLKNLSAKIMFLMLILVAVIFVINLIQHHRALTGALLIEEINRSRELTYFCEQIRQFIGLLWESSAFDEGGMRLRAEKELAAGKAFNQTDIYLTIPVVSSWTAAEAKAQELGYEFRIPKNQPRNPKNQPRPGVEQAVVDYLEGHGSLEAIERRGVRIIWPEDKASAIRKGEIGLLHQGQERLNAHAGGAETPINAVRFFKAIRLTQDCMACHGDPAGSQDMLGFNKEGWKVGGVHGAFQIIIPLTLMQSELQKATKSAFIFAVIVMIATGFIVLYFSRKVIGRPIERMVEHVKKIGQGDFSTALDVKSKDELGVMTIHLNASVTNIRKMLYRLIDTSGTLKQSSLDLSTISRRITDSAYHVSLQSETVASSAEEISVSIQNIAVAAQQAETGLNDIVRMAKDMFKTIQAVAALSQQTAEKVKGISESGGLMSTAVSSVASAIEEMTASLNEVAKQTVKANAISTHSSRNVAEINEKMHNLALASTQIGKIVNVIKEIADQTNMLALNAAIEAAGAGESGKGFAVVAGEVKDLAQQSAKATEEISNRIESIQVSIAEVGKAVNQINQVIIDNSAINHAIMAAVEEQTATAAEISQSMVGSASMAQNVSRLVSDASLLITDIADATGENSRSASAVTDQVIEISRDIEGVAKAVGEASTGSADISRNIQGVSLGSKQIADQTAVINQAAYNLTESSAKLNTIVHSFKVGQEKFDIGKVKAAHLAWRSKLETTLRGSGGLTATEIQSERECEFGQWYFGPDTKAFEHDPLFIKVGRHHEALHQLVAETVNYAQAGDLKNANKSMKLFERERELLFESLEAFYLS